MTRELNQLHSCPLMQPAEHDIKTKRYFINEVKVSESSSKITKIIPRRLLMY